MVVIQLLTFTLCSLFGVLFISEAVKEYGSKSDLVYAGIWLGLAVGVMVA